jgi:hypothetical protein
MDKQIMTQHEQLNELMNPLLDFMNENNFNYMLVAGKDGTCARYCNGNKYEVEGMLSGMVEKHPEYKEVFLNAVDVNK